MTIVAQCATFGYMSKAPKVRRKPASERLEEIVRVRVSKDDLRALEAAAERETLGLTAWARRALLKAAGV